MIREWMMVSRESYITKRQENDNGGVPWDHLFSVTSSPWPSEQASIRTVFLGTYQVRTIL
jgi:hypothetical protein